MKLNIFYMYVGCINYYNILLGYFQVAISLCWSSFILVCFSSNCQFGNIFANKFPGMKSAAETDIRRT